MTEQVFSMTTFWTWDGRHGGTLRIVKLWLSMFGMTLIADKTSAKTIIITSFILNLFLSISY
jgi:hypothetical protein